MFKSKRTNSFKLLLNSLRFYKQNFWRFTRVAALVVLLSSIIKAYDVAHSNSNDLALVLYLAGLYVFLALLWLNFNHSKATALKISQIYRQSSGRFLPFLAISLLQGLMSLPLIFGFFIIIVAIAVRATPLLILPGALLVLLSIVLLVWYSLAGLIIVEESSTTSLKALKTSRKLVKGNFWELIGDYVLFIIVLGLGSGLILQLVTVIKPLSTSWFFQGIINGLLLTVILVTTSIFGYNVYQDLHSHAAQTKQTASQKKS